MCLFLFSFFSAPNFRRKDMKNLPQWIFKVLMGGTGIGAAGETDKTGAQLSSPVLSPNHWRSKWNRIFFYLFCLHLFPLLLVFGCFISLRTQPGRSHTCWGAWITKVESIAGMSIPWWWISGDISEQKSPKTRWKLYSPGRWQRAEPRLACCFPVSCRSVFRSGRGGGPRSPAARKQTT